MTELVGVAEVAKILGVTKQRAHQLRDHPDFPEPIERLACGPIWEKTQITEFNEQWPRRAGRPKSG